MKSNNILAKKWLSDFESHVQNQNYQSSLTLFSKKVKSFGTYSNSISGLDNLMNEQWKKIWSRTSDFTFLTELPSFDVWSSLDGSLVSIAAEWKSVGYSENGTSFERTGRCSITLTKEGDVLLATHTHFSFNNEHSYEF